MGIFSSIGKAFKSVFDGIMKVFEPILEPLAKLMNSKLGKAIMIGLSIFTLGTAMVAGAGAFSAAQAAGQGFISSFVEGGKVFLQTLVGKGAEKGADAAAQAGEGIMKTGETVAGLEGGAGAIIEQGSQAVTEGAGALTEAATSGSGAFGPGATGDMPMRAVTAGGEASGAGAMLPAEAAATGAGQASTGVAPAVTGAETGGQAIQATADAGWLSKAKDAASGFVDYAKSEGGGQVVGSLISAAGNYYTEKDRQEFEDRVRRQWGKGTGDEGIRNIRAAGGRASNLDAPTGVPAAGRATAREGGGRPYFDRAYGAGAPAGG